MEMMKDFFIVAMRIFTIFPLMLIIVHFMGKRSVGELPVFDFLVILTLGAVVGADIADPKIAHIHTAVAIILIGILQRVVSRLAIKKRKFGRLISFEPTIVVYKGDLVKENLQKERYSIDNILQMLREKDIFNITEVELAVLEANGRLSVYKKPVQGAVENLGMTGDNKVFAYPLILEGVVSEEVLSYLNIDETWLEEQLRKKKIERADVFFASIDEKLEVTISQSYPNQIPPLRH